MVRVTIKSSPNRGSIKRDAYVKLEDIRKGTGATVYERGGKGFVKVGTTVGGVVRRDNRLLIERRLQEKLREQERAKAELLRKAKEASAIKERSLRARQALRNKLITKLINDNRRIGVLTSKQAAARVIDARLRTQTKKKTIIAEGRDEKGTFLYEVKGEVQPVKKEKGIKGKIQRLNTLQKKKSTASIRNKQRKIKNELSLLGLTIGTTIISGGKAIIAMPKTVIEVAKKPSMLLKIPSAIAEGGKRFGQLIRVSPTEALGVFAGEVLLLKGTGKAFTITGKVTGAGVRTVARINPKYTRLVNGKFKIRNAPVEEFFVRGKVRRLKSRVQKPSIKRPFSSVNNFLRGRKPGQFRKFTKDPGLILKTQTVASGAKPLSEQAKLAGKEVTAVNAAADQITSWLRRKKIVRKPIPGQKVWNDYSVFPKRIGGIIKKFDSGKKLTNKEFAEVNLWLQKNTAPNITLLERSLYLDPEAGLRVSRLGIQKAQTATLKDILKGNFRLWQKAQKPQVLIFENAKVARFPKSLRSIQRKLLLNKKLTVSETNKLIRWQVQTGSGKFKPIGSTIYSGGMELEVTLAPGEMIKRIKRVGFTYIDGKKVNFVTAEVFKPTKVLLNKIKKAQLGKMNNKELSSLEKALSKKLGKRIRIETPTTKRIRTKSNIPVLRIRGRGLQIVRSRRLTKGRIRRPTRKAPKRPKRPIRKTPKRTRKRTPTPRKAKRPVKRPPKRPTPRTPKRPVPKRPPVIIKPTPRTPKRPPIIRLPKGFKKKKLSRVTNTYYVVEKVKGKMKKLYPKPLKINDARDLAAYKIDNRLSKTALLVPIGKSKTIISPPRTIQGYYSKVKRKLRPYKIRQGKKKLLLNGFIEKRKYFLDTKGEKRQAVRARKKKVVKRRVVRRKKKR